MRAGGRLGERDAAPVLVPRRLAPTRAEGRPRERADVARVALGLLRSRRGNPRRRGGGHARPTQSAPPTHASSTRLGLLSVVEYIYTRISRPLDDFRERRPVSSAFFRRQLALRCGVSLDYGVQTNWQPVESQRAMLWARDFGKAERFMDALGHLHFERRQCAGESRFLVLLGGGGIDSRSCRFWSKLSRVYIQGLVVSTVSD